MRALGVFALLLFLAFPHLRAAETAPSRQSQYVWDGLAGMAEEKEAEDLELRDELISSHMGYMTAMEAALAEANALAPDSREYPLAWARVEYLLETSYRLLESTGEHDYFLKATSDLKPEPPAPQDPVSLDADSSAAPGGGLVYEDGTGQRLTPARVGDRTVLVGPDGKEALANPEKIVARPAGDIPVDARACARLVRARAAWLRALVLERLGRAAEAADEAKGLGLIRDWLILGLMDGESEADSGIDYDLENIYESLGGGGSGRADAAGWRPAASADPLGRLFFDSYFRSEGPRSALALALVHSPDDRGAVVRFGTSAAAAVSVNHIESGRFRSGAHADPDQEAFNVWLRKGWNTVLVRTASPGRDGWSLSLRLTGLDGSPFPGFVLKPTAGDVDDVLAAAARAAARSLPERHYRPDSQPDQGGLTGLSRWLSGNDGDARAHFYLASFLVARRMMEGTERFNREMIFRQAIELSGGNPFFTLMAARSVDFGVEGPDREENLRLVLLKTVANQGSAAALVDIGRLYLDVMRQPRRANEYVRLALSVNPMSLRAEVLDYDVAVGMGWKPVAKNLLENLVKRHPSAAAARLRLGRSALENGKYRQALAEFHALLGIDAGNAEALNGAVVSLGMLGQTSAATDLLINHVQRFPHDMGARLKLAGLYRVLGRDDAAREVITAVLAMAPDDPGALAVRRDIAREANAGGEELGDAGVARQRRLRQALDMTPPRETPPDGWEYLYFQVEDSMERGGGINRTVSFALRAYTARATRMLRHFGFWIERDFERGEIKSLWLIDANGSRRAYTPPSGNADDGTLQFYLPPLQPGMAVEAEVEIRRERIPFLGDYFGQIAPMTQQAPIRLSRYMFTSPKDRRVFFLPVNGAPEAMVVDSPDGQEVTRIWEMSDLPGFTPEPHSPGRNQSMPGVQVSSLGDWDEFARWYWRLVGGQHHAPPELQLLAMNIGREEPVPLAKLDLAAAWVAKNIGHREWEYGPYAFRPINARSILSRLSADGKDRTLLLCLLAREYGLKAWPVLTRMRDRRFAAAGAGDLSLPLLDHFNHSLVMVESGPGGNIFLDASNPYRPSGVMPSQLFGSDGVAIAAGSVEKILIPDGGTAGCEWDESAYLEVDEDGSIIWEDTLKGTGTAAEALRLRFRDPDTRDDAWTGFLRSLGGNPSAASETFEEDPSSPAGASFAGKARLRRMATVQDDRIFLTVPALPGRTRPGGGTFAFPLSLDEFSSEGFRKQDLVLPHGFRIARKLEIAFPEEWELVNPAETFSREYPFGTVTLASELSPGNLKLAFTVEVPAHRLASADYQGFREMSALCKRWLRPLLVWEKP